MKPRILVLCAFALLVSLSSCYYDNEEALYPNYPGNDNCSDTTIYPTNPTYTLNIQPLITKQCGSCHSGSGPGNIKLTTFAELKDAVNNNNMLSRITDAGGVTIMPPSGIMSDCKVSMIDRWVTNGMPE